MRGVLTAFAPDSLRAWHERFLPLDASVVFIGEAPEDPSDLAGRLHSLAQGRPVRIFSGHESLRRDRAVADLLLSAGIQASAQAALAVKAGMDKMTLKTVLGRAGLPTPAWGSGAPADPRGLLCKRRNTTQSAGLTWASAVKDWSAECYWEAYVDGVEFSVVVFREHGRTAVLPVVWKGLTQPDLLPPWRRLRVVPAPRGFDHEIPQMIDISRRLAAAVEGWGFLEVEFILGAGGPSVTDLNPRVCGVTRMVGMATGLRLFDPTVLPGEEELLAASHFVAELPHTGAHFDAEDVIATSRITVRGPSPQEVRSAVARHTAPNVALGVKWPAGW